MSASAYIPIEPTTRHVAAYGLSVAETLSETHLAEAFVEICKQAGNGHVPIAGRLRIFVSNHNLDSGFLFGSYLLGLIGL